MSNETWSIVAPQFAPRASRKAKGQDPKTLPSALGCQIVWSRWSDLNRRPAVYETAALPLSYTGKAHIPAKLL
jgi:hypothetical protein